MSFAQDSDKNILWATDNWPGITDNDTALYLILFKEIFASQGFELQKTIVPFKRAIAFVNQHQADFAGGIIKEHMTSSVHIQAPFPVLTTPVLAFYKKDTITDKTLNSDTLKNYRVVSSPQLGKSIGLTDVYEVTNKYQAFLMVIKGRADVYIDNEGELYGTVKNNSHQVTDYNKEIFATSMVGYSSWYMISPKTSRGETVMKAYIQGSINLFNSGRITEIYQKRGFIIPPELISYISDLSVPIVNKTSKKH